MEFNKALDIIIDDLRDARQIVDDLKKIEGVPVIQVELVKAKCRSAEEILTLLKTLAPPHLEGGEGKTTTHGSGTRPGESATTPPDKEAKDDEPEKATATETESRADMLSDHSSPAGLPVETVSESEVTTRVDSDDISKRKPHSDRVKERDEESREIEIVLSEEREKEKMAEEDEKSKKVAKSGKGEEGSKPGDKKQEREKAKGSKPILADKYVDREKRVSEKVPKRSKGDDLTSRMKSSPISNLASAIGINDRFYFIREVFGGNKESYYEAIEKLNNASTITEARALIDHYGAEKSDSEAVGELLDIVKRKTGADE